MATERSTGTKRKLNEITAEQPITEEVEDQSQQDQPLIPTSTSTPPQLDLPRGLDLENPYAILTHFISEETFQSISRSTNEYAAQQDQSSSSSTSRTWKDTTVDDIKVFFGLIIYMSVHISPRHDFYWNTDQLEGPLHSSRHYMGQKRFETIKRFLQIPPPDNEHESEQVTDQPGASSSPSSSNNTIARANPGNELEEELQIPPTNIHDYIQQTGSRDFGYANYANLDRKSHKIYGNSRSRFPAPLPYPFLEAAIVKAWRIQRTYKKQQGAKGNKLPCQREFRTALYQEFFVFARHHRPQPQLQKHKRVQLPGNTSEKTIRQVCAFCQIERKQSKVTLPGRAGKSTSGCLECGNVPLCLKTKCWDKWHNLSG
jgi:hypothetical protein